MNRLAAALAALFLSGFPAVAQAQGTRQSNPYFPVGYCQLTSMAAATQLSTCAGGIPQRTVIAEICVEAQGVRYRDDGVAPTASVGIPVPAGTCFAYAGTMGTLQFIQQTAGAIVNVSFYK